MLDLINASNDSRPTIFTERLILRPFRLDDANTVQILAGHPLVAETTASIPHPYPDGASQSWIEQHSKWFQDGQSVQFAICVKNPQSLIGCIDLLFAPSHARAELGYWIGVDFWNQGYCTEAAKAVVEFGFAKLQLNKITSRHLGNNPSSGRVMTKIGMKKEGSLREHFLKNGILRDIEVYGLLKTDV
jgi:ribosomal-protein-alanine N-acetyltransferase